MPRKTRNKFNLLSLFSGAGALDQGFELTGRFRTRACIDMQPAFCQTLLRNQDSGYFPDATVLEASIQDVSPAKVLTDHFDGIAPDGIIGGPPCESFSSMGKQAALDDPRGQLVFDFCNWVHQLRPRFFLFENVPHLAHRHDGIILSKLLDNLRSSGYNVNHQIMTASQFGAATKRKRLIIIGFADRPQFLFPKQTHGEPGNPLRLKDFRTVGEALDGLPDPFDTSQVYPTWHQRITHTKSVIERFEKLLPGQQDKVRKRWRLSLNHPSPSLIAGNLVGIRSHIHPIEPRELTNRESARLHGFTDDFIFCGNRSAVGKQIANAVPIPLAHALAQAVAEHLDSKVWH